MAPIHDSDLAEERWIRASWLNYQLWEKVEAKERKKRKRWLAGACLAFLLFSSLPIVLDQWPKWVARSLIRKLSVEINEMKLEAIFRGQPIRLSIWNHGDSDLRFKLEKLLKCSDLQGEMFREGVVSMTQSEEYVFLSSHQAQSLGIPGVVDSFCYDPIQGSNLTSSQPIVGMGILKKKDLEEKRLDRLILLTIQGSSGEISFD